MQCITIEQLKSHKAVLHNFRVLTYVICALLFFLLFFMYHCKHYLRHTQKRVLRNRFLYICHTSESPFNVFVANSLQSISKILSNFTVTNQVFLLYTVQQLAVRCIVVIAMGIAYSICFWILRLASFFETGPLSSKTQEVVKSTKIGVMLFVLPHVHSFIPIKFFTLVKINFEQLTQQTLYIRMETPRRPRNPLRK